MADLLRDILNLNVFTPRYMMKTAFEVMLQSADVFKRITSEGDGGVAWQEFQNKLQAFYIFEHVDSVLGISPDHPVSLDEMVSRASALGPFFSAWATEGVGHFYTQLLPMDGNTRLLNDAARQRLTVASMLPLHTGMGLALAEAVLPRRLDPASTAEIFLRFCRNNSQPDYLGAAIEALGLVVRNLYPELLRPLSDYFQQSNPELCEYFWHGVGRGIYFAPINFMPYWSVPWQGYEMCLREPPSHETRRNAVAGFAWAMLLVNLRHPRIMAAFLERHGAQVSHDDAFANGLFSAATIWQDCAPDDSSLLQFLNYPNQNPQLRELWQTQVNLPITAAFHRNKTQPIGDFFRYSSRRL